MHMLSPKLCLMKRLLRPDWITISPSGLITGTPENEHVGEHTVTVKVTDSAGASDTKTFIITVNAVNEAPTVSLLSEPEAGLEEFYFFEESKYHLSFPPATRTVMLSP